MSPKKLRDKLQRGHVTRLKPGLYIIVTIAEHVCDDASLERRFLSCYNIDCKYFLWKINTYDYWHDVETKSYLDSSQAFANAFLSFPRMPSSSHSCNDRRYSYFTENICNRYVGGFKTVFRTWSQARFAIVRTTWRPGFSLSHSAITTQVARKIVLCNTCFSNRGNKHYRLKYKGTGVEKVQKSRAMLWRETHPEVSAVLKVNYLAGRFTHQSACAKPLASE